MIEKIVHTAKQAVKEKVLIQSAMPAPGAVWVAGGVMATVNLSPDLFVAGPIALASITAMTRTRGDWIDDDQIQVSLLLYSPQREANIERGLHLQHLQLLLVVRSIDDHQAARCPASL
ncbi:MAG: hypothetical protein V4656_08460 [Pseudomonadota bacterium]